MVESKTKFVIIAVILALFVGIFIFRATYNSNQDDGDKVYQCSDGIDNDGDNLIDYRDGTGDPDCKSDTDRFEKELPSIWWLVLIICMALLLVFGIRYYKNKNAIEDIDYSEKLRIERVDNNRAYDLAISNMLRFKMSDMPCDVVTEDDGYELHKPYFGDIVEQKRKTRHFNTPHLYQFSFININNSPKYRGTMCLVYCITKGEKFCKNNLPEFSPDNIYNFKMESRTWKPESPMTEKAMLNSELVEAIREGDVEGAEDLRSIMRIYGNANQSDSNESDDEFYQRVRLENMNNRKKKVNTKKNDKASTGAQPVAVPSNDFNDGGEE